jgi:hypothetical protein
MSKIAKDLKAEDRVVQAGTLSRTVPIRILPERAGEKTKAEKIGLADMTLGTSGNTPAMTTAIRDPIKAARNGAATAAHTEMNVAIRLTSAVIKWNTLAGRAVRIGIGTAIAGAV